MVELDLILRLGIDGIVGILQAFRCDFGYISHSRSLKTPRNTSLRRYSPDDIIDP
jgi:hypothetical protein